MGGPFFNFGGLLLLVALALSTGSVSDSVTLHQVVVSPAETLTVTMQGDGRPVVLIPGLFGSRYGFRHLAPALAAEGFQAIVIEPLGIGTSARPKEADYSLAAQAGRIAAAMDTLRLAGSIAVAHSLGAGMTYRLAVLRPDLVTGIVSIEGGPVESATTPGLRFWLKLSGLLKLAGRGVLLGEVERSLKSSSGDPSWVTREVVAGYTTGIARNSGAAFDALKGMARAREPWPLAPRLATISGPVRLMIGAATHKSGMAPEEIATLAAMLPTFSVDSIAGVGHYIFEEQPAAVVRAVREVGRELADRD
jgi:pimeloyl-ACP methyl ester carboxylesterase